MNQSTNVRLIEKPIMNYLCRSDGKVVFISVIEENFKRFKTLYENVLPNTEFLTLTDEEYDIMFPKEVE
jgi:hypothetical protein